MENISKIEGYELLSQKVYRVLKTKIIEGSLKPGTKLLEEKVANKMEVSRTPIREAFRELAANGFIKMTTNHGAIVSNVSLEDLKDVLQIRGVLEGLAAYRAAITIGGEEIKELEEYLKQMEDFNIEDDALAFSEMDAEFHELILDICGSRRLIKICRNLTEITHRFRIKSLSIPGRLKYSLKEHRDIVKALKRGDSMEASRLSQVHVDNVLKNILEDESKKRGGQEKDA